MFLDEYGTVLLDYGARISLENTVFWDHSLGYEKSDCTIG
jgi:hypothetical protein